MLVLSIDVDY
jgi:hypothetical protein